MTILLLQSGPGAARTGPPVISVFATFDGTPSAGVTMSNGNLTVTHGTTNNGAGNASTTTLSTGKYYFEITISGTQGAAHACGIRPYTAGAFIDSSGTFTGGIGVSQVVSAILNNGTNTGVNLGTPVTGDVYGFAIDLTARLAWIRRNNGTWNADVTANPATATNGLTLVAGAISPSVRFTNTGAANAFTGNFGQSAFVNAAPSGFSLGWGT